MIDFERMRALGQGATRDVLTGLEPAFSRCLAQETAEIAFRGLNAVVETRAAEALRKLTEGQPALTGEQYAQVRVWTRDDVLRMCRDTFVQRFGFAVITDDAIATIKQHVAAKLLLEVGAGNGYVAAQLLKAGVDVLPTDINALEENPWGLGKTEHASVIKIAADQAIKECPGAALLWCWPARGQACGEALAMFEGETFIYIGEGEGGCTGGDYFWEVLSKDFSCAAMAWLPSFPNIHDNVYVFQRRSG